MNLRLPPSLTRTRLTERLRLLRNLLLVGMAVVFSGFDARGQAAAFSGGNLVVCRVGAVGGGTLTQTGNPMFLDEFTPTGGLVQSIPLPTAINGANRRLVASGIVPAEGALSRSADGRSLIVMGYDAAIPYSTALPGTAAADVPRVIGRVGFDGRVNTTTYLRDAGADGSPLSATTGDGSAFWLVGAGGIRYAAAGPDAAAIQLTPTVSNLRQVAIFQNQLYTSAAGGFRVGKVGSGLPTTSGQSISGLPGVAGTGSPSAFVLVDLVPTLPGPDTLYLADEVLGLQKFSLVGGNWVNNGGIGNDNDDYRGLTAMVNGNAVTLFAIRKGGSTAAGGGELVRLIDTTGYNGAFTGNPTVLINAASKTAFRGIALAPVAGIIPLPDLVVEVSAPAAAVAGSPFDYMLTVRNPGAAGASDIAVKFQLPAGLTFVSSTQTDGFSIASTQAPDLGFAGGTLAAGAAATLTVRVVATAAGTYSVASGVAVVDPYQTIVEGNETNNASPNSVATEVTLPLVPPIIISHPGNQTVPRGKNALLSLGVTGNPTPVVQWYLGDSGDISNPVAEANGNSYTTPALTVRANYWARATNSEGSVDSTTAVLYVPSDDASLASLALSAGGLSPKFDAQTYIYHSNVNYDISSVTLSLVTGDPGATVKINGISMNPGTTSGTPLDPGGGDPVITGAPPAPSAPVSLVVGGNSITIEVIAEDGTTTLTYTVNVARAPSLLIATQAASGVTSAAAVLRGTVTPNGVALVRFEYGLTAGYGNFTAYQEVSGSAAVSVAATLSHLTGGTSYHFRSVADKGGVIVTGGDFILTTLPDPPVALTGSAVAVSSGGATLVGAVHPNGLVAQVRFIYGLSTLYGSVTPIRRIPPMGGLVDLTESITGLIPGATYHYRLIATTTAGTRQGADASFVATAAGSGSGLPSAPPAVTTGSASGVDTDSADLLGSVTPNGGATVVRFEYGMTTAYGQATAMQGVGNGNGPVAVSLAAGDLLPGTVYHYRLVAANSLGTTQGADAQFTTDPLAATVVTGAADAVSTTIAMIAGTVRARGSETAVYVDYGISPASLSNSISASPGMVTGELTTAVGAELSGLVQGTTYYYQVRAVNGGGTSVGEVLSFDVGVLSGLFQQFPGTLTEAGHSGSVTVNLTPVGSGGGWRIAGEQQWRASGSSVTGMASGDRVIEYRPAPGFLQPASETAVVISEAGPLVLDRGYTPSAAAGSGSLTVMLKPQAIAAESVPEATRAQWRLDGESDAQWRNSGTTVSGLIAGDYVIECKAVASRTTPAPVTARVADGATTLVTCSYTVAEDPVGTSPAVVSFATVSSEVQRPYAYVGQLTSDAGASTGFVVRPRVVATAGHVVFDDGTLAAATGLQWLFQRDRGVHEPAPQTPRGYYVMSGYAAQRSTENSPGVSSPQSQNLDVAALYFPSDAGRGGYSGYFASDSMVNEFVVSSALKTLVGYPVEGISPTSQGRMHATPLANVAFASAYGQTYTTSEIRGGGGNSGGPLCVQQGAGTFYPAAIYLGGSAQMVVRAIDGEVVNLFGLAEASGEAGVGSSGGGISETVMGTNSTPVLGSLQVVIEPAAARAAGAGWRVQAVADYATSGTRIDNLEPNSYTVQFATVAGFVPPAPQTLEIPAGQLTTITFTYQPIMAAPVISSPEGVAGVRGQSLTYQITATQAPEWFTLLGALPGGMTFDAETGLIDGFPQESGVFPLLIGAANAGGAGTRGVTLTVRPALDPQSVTAPLQSALNYHISSSESGDGITYSATNLPAGLALNPVSGWITGTPTALGVYPVPITVVRNGAVSGSVLTLTVVNPLPVITKNPIAVKSINYGLKTTLSVAATSSTTTTYQWYQGESGDTSNPVIGATSATLTTTELTANTTFWVRATSADGSTDSTATLIRVLPSVNANLSALKITPGTLTPVFNPGIRSYAVSVPSSVTSLDLSAGKQVAQSSVAINGQPYDPGEGVRPVSLASGINTITVAVTAGDGRTQSSYVITIHRTTPPVGSTLAATAVTPASALLHGTVVPNGNGSAWFEYGRTAGYGQSTPKQPVSGTAVLPVEAALSGLAGSLIYHYRLVVVTGAEISYGADMTFSSSSDPPLAATGSPILTVGTEATLVGGVNPRGLATEVYFEYGLTPAYGSVTATQGLAAGSSVVDVFATLSGLSEGTRYYCRIVATSAAGTTQGDGVSFQALPGGGAGSVQPPSVSTGSFTDVTTSSVVLQGQVNPNGGATFAFFEYGTTLDYGSSTPHQGIGNGTDPAAVTLSASGLLPGTLYHYRVVAENSEGTSHGTDATFTSGYAAPAADTQDAEALAATVVRVTGTVTTGGSSTAVHFDYGTDGVIFSHSILAAESPVDGGDETAVSAEIPDLDGATVYFYRVRAVGSGGTASGGTKSFQINSLLGRIQEFPNEMAADDRQGVVQVNLLPTGVGGWRFAGETEWRASGTGVTGLTSGDRQIEFQPVAGHVQPQSESVGVVSGEEPVVLERLYYDAGTAGTGSMAVQLKPIALTDGSLPVGERAQWRLAGDAGGAWLESGETLTGLLGGSYLVECKAIAGRETPVPVNVVIAAGESATATVTYLTASDPAATVPLMVPFATVATSQDQPYAYVGQLRSGTGSFSGFAVKSRVVATVAQAVFDEATLTMTGNLQWLLQQDRGGYEPVPQVPRGFYAFDSYAAQRATEGTPGALAEASQNLNVAALYFDEDAGRGGFSGFLAGEESSLGGSGEEEPEDEVLLSSSLKTLVGYPLSGISPTDLGRMHATVAADASFGLASGDTYATPDIQGLTGMLGGPLCVRYEEGIYYPAGIYVGGVTGSAVRAITRDVVDLFTRAASSGNGGANDTGGGITQTSFTVIGDPSDPGALKVTIEPEAARTAGAGWRLAPESSYRSSGAQKYGLTPGSFVLQFRGISGFQEPAGQVVTISGGQLQEITFTYLVESTAQELWRLANFGTAANTGDAADSADPDQDGSRNLAEYAAATDPNDITDVFRVLTAAKAGSTFTATANGKATRTYVLERCATLDGSWADIDSIGPLAVDGGISLSDAVAPAGTEFYRIRVAAP